jgi:hypothetical protein
VLEFQVGTTSEPDGDLVIVHVADVVHHVHDRGSAPGPV